MERHSYGWKDTDATGAHDYLWPALLRRVRQTVPRAGRIVDMGCGNGYVAGRLARLGYQVVAFDASPDGVELAKKQHPGVQFHVASVYDEGLADLLGGPADLAIAVEVVEHLYYPKKLFTTARTLLASRGQLVVTTPYHGYLKNLALSLANGWDRHFTVEWDGGHIKFFSPATLSRMASQAGFRVYDVRGVGRMPGLWKSMVVSARAP